MLTVAKFGGSSLADSARFLQAATIIRQDPSRRVIVVSAAGKRFESDTKITDLLYGAHSRCAHGGDGGVLFDRVRQRYLQICDGCGLQVDLEAGFSGNRGEFGQQRGLCGLPRGVSFGGADGGTVGIPLFGCCPVDAV